MKKRILILTLSIIMILTNHASEIMLANGLSKEQKKVADKVAAIATNGWHKYGILPSVAVAQTFIESSLGVHQVRSNNMWGIRPKGHYASYKTFEDGMYAYLNVLNNGRYDKALYKKDYRDQLSYILKGGYYGEDDGGTIEWYYSNCVRSIKQYGFDEYDKNLLSNLKKEKTEKKRKKKWKKTYTLVYDDTIKDSKVKVDKSIVKKGSVLLWKDNELKGIYDVTGGQKGFNISVSEPELDGMKVKIEVLENAKG